MKNRIAGAMLATAMFIIGLTSCNEENKQPVTAKVPATPIQKVAVAETHVPTAKEVWLSKATYLIKQMVADVDSIQSELVVDSTKNELSTPVKVHPLQDTNWKETVPTTKRWIQYVTTHESNDTIGKHKMVSHIGHAYLRNALSKEIWTYNDGWGDEITFKRVQYGVLLSPDTLNGVHYPTGTFVVVPQHFVKSVSENVEHPNQAKYFRNKMQFIAYVSKEIDGLRNQCDNPGTCKRIIIWK